MLQSHTGTSLSASQHAHQDRPRSSFRSSPDRSSAERLVCSRFHSTACSQRLGITLLTHRCFAPHLSLLAAASITAHAVPKSMLVRRNAVRPCGSLTSLGHRQSLRSPSTSPASFFLQSTRSNKMTYTPRETCELWLKNGMQRHAGSWPLALAKVRRSAQERVIRSSPSFSLMCGESGERAELEVLHPHSTELIHSFAGVHGRNSTFSWRPVQSRDWGWSY